MACGDPTSNWVRLNVGGKIFLTTKHTLCKEQDSFFSLLFESELQPSVKDESDAYVIDRSPEHMDTILNYLRSGHLSITDRKLIPALMNEADFYGIPGMIKLLEAESKKITVKELISVVNGEWGGEPKLFVLLPTADAEYDVLKELKSERHLANYFEPKERCGPLVNGGFCAAPNGPQTFLLIRNHVTKVVSELGFEIQRETDVECTFVRYVYK